MIRRGALEPLDIVVLGLVAVAGIGLPIYLAEQNHQLSDSIASKNNQIASLQKQVASTTRPADPYAGWKTYCDSTEKACFKYPSDWTASVHGQGNLLSVSLRNPSGNVLGNYMNNDTRDGFFGTLLCSRSRRA